MSEITLKPCPCCGGAAEILKQGYREYAPTYSVRCKVCGLTTGNHKSEKEAADRWNTRKPIDQIVEILEEEMPISWKHDYIGGMKDAFMEAIEIVKEEGGIND